MENGGTLKGFFAVPLTGTPYIDEINLSKNMRDHYKRMLLYKKECDNAMYYGCFHNSLTYLNGNKSPAGMIRADAGLVLNNGTLMMFSIHDVNCNATISGADFKYCGQIEVDVNGFKKPNIVGKDIFGTYVTEDGLIPFGARGSDNSVLSCVKGSTSSENNGYGCSAKYLLE